MVKKLVLGMLEERVKYLRSVESTANQIDKAAISISIREMVGILAQVDRLLEPKHPSLYVFDIDFEDLGFHTPGRKLTISVYTSENVNSINHLAIDQAYAAFASNLIDAAEFSAACNFIIDSWDEVEMQSKGTIASFHISQSE